MFEISVINIEISNDIEQSLKFAESNGFGSIEIHSAWGKNIETMEKEELILLNQRVRAHGLRVSCISSTLFLRCFLDDHSETAPEIRVFPAIFGDYNFHLKSLQKVFLAAEILEAPLIRVFGFQKEAEMSDETFTIAAERFRKPAEQAKQAGYILAIENCPYTSFGWGTDAIRLVQLIDSPAFRLLWDPAGGVRAGEPNCIQAMPVIVPLLAHMHAKDISPASDGKERYPPIGKGVVPWNIIIEELINQKYEGAVSIETHAQGDEGRKAGAVLESLTAMQEIISLLQHQEESSTL